MEPWLLLAAWVGALSLAAFAAAWRDKTQARRGGPRVREATLLGLALAGGSPGLVAAMLLVWHKTRKASFLLRLGAVLAAQAALAWAWVSLVGTDA